MTSLYHDGQKVTVIDAKGVRGPGRMESFAGGPGFCLVVEFEHADKWGTKGPAGQRWAFFADETSDCGLTIIPEPFVAEPDPRDAEIERLRAALEAIAEEADAGRHDGLPEPCPALDADAMWAIARQALAADDARKAEAPGTPEDMAEQFIAAAISNSPEPLQELGRFLTTVLDEDHWATAESYLLALAASPPPPAEPVDPLGDIASLDRAISLARMMRTEDVHIDARTARAIRAMLVPSHISTLVDKLRASEGSSVTILCDNPDFHGPNNAVEISADWTNWQTVRFSGESLREALQNAVDNKGGVIMASLAPPISQGEEK